MFFLPQRELMDAIKKIGKRMNLAHPSGTFALCVVCA